jgi:hypothetical protein
VVAPPKGLAAPASAVEAARAAPATHVDPANPPTPPTQVDFNQQVQSVITTHSANIDVVNGLAHPRHWDYTYYDTDHHPVFYNPMSEAMTFRYFSATSMAVTTERLTSPPVAVWCSMSGWTGCSHSPLSATTT